LLAIYLGGFWLRAFMFAVSIAGMRELYKAFDNEHRALSALSYMMLIFYYALIGNDAADSLFGMLIGMFVVFNLILFTIYHETISPKDVLVNIFGFFYIGVLLANVYLVQSLEYGAFFVWFIFISAWACDTLAYFSGMFFGKRKLAPMLSPKKTIEGAIGGTLGAAIVSGAFGHMISTHVTMDVNLAVIGAILGLVGAIFAQFGDLSASAIKRHLGIKDYGNLIPGHGGILDRFDSVIFTAPLVYFVVQALL